MTKWRPPTQFVNQAYSGVAEKQSQQRNPKVRSRQKPSHKSNATLESLTSGMNPKQRSRAHSRVCIRNFAAHVNHTNSVRIRLLIRSSSRSPIDSCPRRTAGDLIDLTRLPRSTFTNTDWTGNTSQCSRPEAPVRPFGAKLI
jgi:hypothetical protein